MKIGKIAAYIFAGLMTVSCGKKPHNLPYEKAEKIAARYIKGDEFIKIKNNAPSLVDSISHTNANDRIFYWDSILAYCKFAEGIDSGRKFIIDSIAGKPVKRPDFKVCVDVERRYPEEIVKITKEEVAKYYTKPEMFELLSKEPLAYPQEGFATGNTLTHYYGQIAAQAAQKKGFELGAEGQYYAIIDKVRPDSDTIKILPE